MTKSAFAFLILLTGAMVFNSCKPYYRIFYGIKNPKVENYQSIRENFAKHYKNVPGSVYVVKDSISYRKVWDKIISFPRTQLFNKHGLLILTQDSGYCFARATEFCSKLKKDTLYRVDTTYYLEDVLEMFTPLDASAAGSWKEYDFIFIGYWSVLLGRGNKNITEVYDAISKNKELKILYLFMDIDLMQEWNCISLTNSVKVKY